MIRVLADEGVERRIVTALGTIGLDAFLRADERWHQAFIVVGPESVRYRRLPAK